MNPYRYLLLKLLTKISTGGLVLIDGRQQYSFGPNQNNPININITDPRTYKLILTGGALGAGKAYFKQYWQTSHLPDVIHLVLQNEDVFRGIDGLMSKFNYCKDGFLNLLRKNNFIRAKKNIQSHYDLSNQFFKLFLDERMMYSCALFEQPNDGLDKASENKLRHICQKLELEKNDHILEIGTGWGGFALYAALNYGCKVTTTTISTQQFQHVQELVRINNLQKQITVLHKDYRLLTGRFDKICSIEMLEAVGFQYFSAYFSKINTLLKSGGRALIQSIIINDKDYERAKYEVDFIKKYIFPGGCLPSLQKIRHHIKKDTQLAEIDVEYIGQHYVRTLDIWAERFQQSTPEIKGLGFSDEFIKKWLFYFAYCQAGFLSEHINNIQALWIKN